jgi:hypothetical protein
MPGSWLGTPASKRVVPTDFATASIVRPESGSATQHAASSQLARSLDAEVGASCRQQQQAVTRVQACGSHSPRRSRRQ